MNADGSENRMLVPDLPAQGMPAWSPDGRNIAFIGRGRGENYDSLYVTDPNPQYPPRKLADHAYYAYHERWPMWSPDSRYIAFSRRDIGGLYMVEISSGQIRKLSDLMTMYPVWQPTAN
jgi:Tol biopolymer transport system component